MKALIYTEPGRVEYLEAEDARAEDGNVRVAVSAVGICGSDMHAYLASFLFGFRWNSP